MLLDPISLALIGAEGALIGPMLVGSLLFNNQRYGDAVKAFELAARLQPISALRATCYINLAACHAELAHMDRVIEMCDKATAASQSPYVQALAHVNRAHAFLLMGKIEESQKEVEAVLGGSLGDNTGAFQSKRGVRYAMVNYADVLARLGRYKDALEICRKATDPDNGDFGATAAAHQELGLLLVQIGRPQDALLEMKQALQAGPLRRDQRAVIQQIMALAWISIGDAEKAAQCLSKVEQLGIPPVSRSILLQTRSRLSLLLGNLDAALNELRMAEACPQTPLIEASLTLEVAICLAEKREYAAALEKLGKVRAAAPNYKYLQAVCDSVEAQCHFACGRIDDGCRVLKQLRTYQNMALSVDVLCAIAHTRGSFASNQFSDALEWAQLCENLLSQLQGSPDLRIQAVFWHARTLIRVDRMSEAKNRINSALEIPDINPRRRSQLTLVQAEAALATGSMDSAQDLFRECIHLDSDCAEAWFSLGQLLIRQGRLDEGTACLKAAAAADSQGSCGSDARAALQELRQQSIP